MKHDARTAALQALLQVEESEGYSNIVIDKTIRQMELPPREAALASALFYGVLEKRIAIDWALNQFCKKPVEKLDASVRELLRLAVYQLLYMDKIPDSAAVNEAVKACRQVGKSSAAGFVNGVLRNLLRQREALRWPETGDESLSVRYGCPVHWITFWRNSYGEDFCRKMLESLAVPPFLYARVNPLRGSVEEFVKKAAETGMKATPVESVPGAVRLEHTGSVAEHPLYQQGWFHIQDLSSQVCVMQGEVRPGMRVVDVCAAPGGKTFTAGEWMDNQGELFAYDLYKGKVGLICSGAERLGLTCVQAAVRNAETPAFSPEPADVVFCDAPCSGLGILRRKPEIRYKKPESLRELPGLQKRILHEAAKLVKPGGRLVYSTCTLNPDENGLTAGVFLKEHPEFTAIPVHIPAGMSRAVQEPEHQFTMTPFSCGTDGFFVAVFEKKQES
ncbi:MAG TPA: 16S rRNA (cytosine(967)-C(5))-methyltransferase RsmB [Candidatus Gallacutalibacter pullistercoris]|nr:16S rRNA (cytosine(967)-C(5))-methyltransferase RsmB [Candidatus Gallacutalibacter pullistercoris]